ncbi:MAG: hypothetical protein WB791_02230 [Waddliaceae bacterium]
MFNISDIHTKQDLYMVLNDIADKLPASSEVLWPSLEALRMLKETSESDAKEMVDRVKVIHGDGARVDENVINTIALQIIANTPNERLPAPSPAVVQEAPNQPVKRVEANKQDEFPEEIREFIKGCGEAGMRNPTIAHEVFKEFKIQVSPKKVAEVLGSRKPKASAVPLNRHPGKRDELPEHVIEFIKGCGEAGMHHPTIAHEVFKEFKVQVSPRKVAEVLGNRKSEFSAVPLNRHPGKRDELPEHVVEFIKECKESGMRNSTIAFRVYEEFNVRIAPSKVDKIIDPKEQKKFVERTKDELDLAILQFIDKCREEDPEISKVEIALKVHREFGLSISPRKSKYFLENTSVKTETPKDM